jgi:hypothetical protein
MQAREGQGDDRNRRGHAGRTLQRGIQKPAIDHLFDQWRSHRGHKRRDNCRAARAAQNLFQVGILSAELVNDRHGEQEQSYRRSSTLPEAEVCRPTKTQRPKDRELADPAGD